MCFADDESARQALASEPPTIDGRVLSIQRAKGTKKITPEQIAEKKKLINENTRTIFVKNLPYDMTEDQLGDYFMECGKIENVRFVYNPTTKTFKGSTN